MVYKINYMAREQSGSKSNWKFMVENFLKNALQVGSIHPKKFMAI